MATNATPLERVDSIVDGIDDVCDRLSIHAKTQAIPFASVMEMLGLTAEDLQDN